MLALALDSSTLTLSCALAELSGAGVARVLAESAHPPPLKAGDALPGVLQELCAAAGLQLDEVSAIAVGLGPGSFTGLRVGAAAAKALAYARRWPVAGCSSLRALALAVAGRVERGTLIVATTEARKGELYAAAFRAGLPAHSGPAAVAQGAGPATAAEPRAPEGAPFAVHPRELQLVHAEAVFSAAPFAGWLRRLPGACVLAGSGARACADLLALEGLDLAAVEARGAPETPPAAAVAALCAEGLRAGAFDPAALFALGPNYLRPSEAEVALGQGRVGGLSPAQPRGDPR